VASVAAAEIAAAWAALAFVVASADAVHTEAASPVSTYDLSATTVESTVIWIVFVPSLYDFVSPAPIERAVLIASWDISPIATSELFAYARAVHVEDPLPNLNRLVSDSTPISPAAKIGFTEVHCEAVPLLT